MARSPFALAFVRCLRTAAVPTVATAILGWLASRWLRAPIEATAAAPGASSPWLHLPMFVAAIVAAMTAAVFWPAFAARRPGADWIERLQRGPLRGTGAVVAGALAVQFVLSLPLVLGVARLLGAPGRAVAHVALTPPAEAVLFAPGQSLEFATNAPFDAVELHLRPAAGPPTGALLPTRLRVFAGRERLAADTAGDDAEVAQTGQHFRLRFAQHRIETLRLEMTAGNVPLVFPPGSVTAVRSGTYSGAWNGVLAALLYLVPTFTALAVACLCGRRAGLPTVLAVIGVLIFVQTFGGAGPIDEVLPALLRGQWLPAGPLFWRSLPSLGAGSLAMIGAMLLVRTPRR